jgi:hypothetical protein
MTDSSAIDSAVHDTVPLQRAKRLRLLTILAIAAIAGLSLLTTTQDWWTVKLAGESIPVQGTVAAPALSALALSGLALAAALAIAGPVFRLVLGVLQVVIGFTIVLTTILTLANPEQASESLVSKATSVAGTASITALISSFSLTPWGFVAVGLGVLAIVVGVFELATFRRWPLASRKYSAVRVVPADGPRDAVVDWDTLSRGTDPTEDPGPDR